MILGVPAANAARSDLSGPIARCVCELGERFGLAVDGQTEMVVRAALGTEPGRALASSPAFALGLEMLRLVVGRKKDDRMGEEESVARRSAWDRTVVGRVGDEPHRTP